MYIYCQKMYIYTLQAYTLRIFTAYTWEPSAKHAQLQIRKRGTVYFGGPKSLLRSTVSVKLHKRQNKPPGDFEYLAGNFTENPERRTSSSVFS